MENNCEIEFRNIMVYDLPVLPEKICGPPGLIFLAGTGAGNTVVSLPVMFKVEDSGSQQKQRWIKWQKQF